MPRLRVVLVASFAAIAALFALSLLLAADAQAAPARAEVALPGAASGSVGSIFNAPAEGDPFSIEAISRLSTPISCTLSTTTSVDALGGINSFGSAATLAFYDLLTLASGNKDQQVLSEDDYFVLNNAVSGFYYTVRAEPSGVGNYNLGLIVYNSSQAAILTDTNTLDGTTAQVTLIATGAGPYYFVVSQLTGVCGGTYKLTPSAPTTVTPTPTRTPTATGSPTTPVPTTTALPGADRFEPNFDFDRAALIALNKKEPNLNFVPWAGADPYSRDDDWFKVWVKPGLLVTCETLDLAPGVDTNLILYDNNHNGINGDDDKDRANGDFSSRVSYYVTYEGYLYLDVGQPFAPLPSEVSSFTYSVQCFTGTGPTLTPTQTRIPITPSPSNTFTPSPTPTFSPTPTPTPPFIQVVPLPTVTPGGQPGRVVVPISLQVYYDLNDNRAPDPGEGVVGVSARVIEVASGEQLAHGFTDEFGFVSLNVNASGVVRLVVPYLNYSVLIQPSGSAVNLRIAPHDLPNAIP